MSKNLRHVWYIAINDVKLFWTDRLAVGMFIIFPFLFIVMFNLLLANTQDTDSRLELHLATQETEGISVQMIESLATVDESALPPGAPVIIWEKDYDQAKAAVEDESLAGFLSFPADFTQKVYSGQPTNRGIL